METPEALPYDGPKGTGLKQSGGFDPVVTVSLVFAALSLIPTAWLRASVGAHAFGPLVFPAIFAIVAVLFGFLGIMRSVELGDTRMRNLAIVGIVVGLVRLFVYPMLQIY